MRLVPDALLVLPVLCFSQTAPQTPRVDLPFLRETYTKFEYRIPMRDGARLFTAVYVPKDVFSSGATYPIMLMRTPYGVRPYGVDQYPSSLGPSEFFAREKFIFAYQDVRGRYMSEGVYTTVRPFHPNKSHPRDIDESSDAYDTIDWLVKNVRGNTGKVGMWGISQPGFFVSAAMIGAHPALAAVSPQAPVTDYYLGDDSYHNGAFMLAHRFGFYMGFRQRQGGPEPPQPAVPFDYGTPDAYEFFLDMGPLANADEKYFKHSQEFWTLNVNHPNYDETWQARSIWKYLKAIQPPVMMVGGWFDQEDLQGPLRQFAFMEKNSPPRINMLVMGPWTHGGFARGDGQKVGNVDFGSKTGLYYREKIEFPFFLQLLKGKGNAAFPRARVFETGRNQWRTFDAWPPKTARPIDFYLSAGGKLAARADTRQSFDEYLSDPSKPVPYIGHVAPRVLAGYMTEDQRFASKRPDVLVYQTGPLDHDVTVMGPILADLKVSTSGTDSDFDVKLIDVYPGGYNAAPSAAAPGNPVPMGGYQQLVRGEPFRGKFRKGFEKPVPFEPGTPDRITFHLPDIAHTFRPGHRIMVQVQSSWFPLTDRNPQKFLDIPNAKSTDFVKATERVYTGGEDGSRIRLLVEAP